MGRDLAQLHLRHDGRPEGRGLSPSRREPAGDRQRAAWADGGGQRLSLDPADVPLQRLVLPLDDLRRDGHACVPAGRPRQTDLRRHRRSRRHPYVRRAHRHADPAERPGGGETRLRPDRRFLHRRRPAARGRAGRHGRRRVPGDASLRPDGGLRPLRHQRMETRMGRAAKGGAGPEKGPPGRPLRRA